MAHIYMQTHTFMNKYDDSKYSVLLCRLLAGFINSWFL